MLERLRTVFSFSHPPANMSLPPSPGGPQLSSMMLPVLNQFVPVLKTSQSRHLHIFVVLTTGLELQVLPVRTDRPMVRLSRCGVGVRISWLPALVLARQAALLHVGLTAG